MVWGSHGGTKESGLIHSFTVPTLAPPPGPDLLPKSPPSGPRPHASPTTSLPAAPLAMLGKRWVNRYLRNRGGSVADRSRDRQRKLDGLQKWHFHLAIESLPVMLRLALPSLGCALPEYFWTSCTVVGVIIAITVLGITSYVFPTLTATFYYNLPYQTPPTLTRTALKYPTHGDTAFARSL